MKRCWLCKNKTLGRRRDEYGEYMLGIEPLYVCAGCSKHLDSEPDPVGVK